MIETDVQIRRKNRFAAALFGLGLVQFGGYILNIPGFARPRSRFDAVSLPKVFSDVGGLETFASEFTLVIERGSGEIIEKPITPELYSQLQGPYKRRNVYGAALSYAPRLAEELWRPVFRYGVTGPLRRELGLGHDIKGAKLLIKTKTSGRTDQWLLEGL